MKAPFRRSVLHASILLALAPVALAQAKLEEIVVTATKRTESLQNVPISVNALSGMKMDQAGITNLEKMTAYIPNFSMNQTGISSTITVRGISSGINQSFEQSVGMYNDGIYFGKAQLSRLPLFDMERVEVLRGPQPILFGKNSIAGAVSLITQKPTDEFEGYAQALYEPDANEQDYRFVVNGPITDTLSGRLALLYREMDGWVENLAFKNRDEREEQEQFVRGSLRWQATDDLEFLGKYENAQFDTRGRNVELVNDIILETNPPGARSYITGITGLVNLVNSRIDQGLIKGPKITNYVVDDAKLDEKRTAGPYDKSDNNVNNFLLDAKYALGDHSLDFVTGYLYYKSKEMCDCDYSSAPMLDGSTLKEDYDQFSQEIRLTSPGGEKVDYIAGLYYQKNSLSFNDRIYTPVNSLFRALLASFYDTATKRQFDQDASMWAAFAQATWHIDEQWRLILGGRYTQEDKQGRRHMANYDHDGVQQPINTFNLYNAMWGALNVEPNTQRGHRNEEAFTPQVVVQWDALEDVMLYASYVEGFKSGGYDNRSNADPNPAVQVPGTPLSAVGAWEFDKEEATSYEMGFKSTLLDGAAEVNGAFFYTEYDDLQTSVFDGVVGFNVKNAGKATTQGMELDGRWAMHEYFTLSGSLAYLDFEFDEFPVAQCWFGQQQLEPGKVTNGLLQQCDAKGERKEYTPEWKGVLSGDFHYPVTDALELRATVDYQYSDSYIYTPQLDPRSEQDAFSMVNARIALAQSDDKWEVALIGNNLTDEQFINYGGTGVLASTATRVANPDINPAAPSANIQSGNAYYVFDNRPRSYSLQATYRF